MRNGKLLDTQDLCAGKGVQDGPDEGVGLDLRPGLPGLAFLAFPGGFGAAAAIGGHQPGLAGPFLEPRDQPARQVGRGAGGRFEDNGAGPETDQPQIAVDVHLQGDLAPGVDQFQDVLETGQCGLRSRGGLGRRLDHPRLGRGHARGPARRGRRTRGAAAASRGAGGLAAAQGLQRFFGPRQVGGIAEPDQGHLDGGRGVGRPSHLVMALEQHLPEPRQAAGRGLGSDGGDSLGLFLWHGQGVRPQGLADCRRMAVFQQVQHHLDRIGAETPEGAVGGDGRARLAAHHLFEQLDGLGPVGQTQHVLDDLGRHHLAGVGLDNGLVQQGQAVPHRALGGAGNQGQALGLDLRAFLLADPLQMGGQDRRLDPPQVETLAAGQDGHRHLADLGGGEDELGVGRRLFQGLEQGVEGRGRQHMHFVDDIDLVAGLGRGIADPVQQLAHLVDLGAAGGVQFQDVHVPALDDGGAVAALMAEIHGGLMDRIALEIQGPGQQPGGGGLAHPPHPGQHEGMGDPAGAEGVGQGPDHGLLADQVLEGAGPVLAGQHGIGRPVGGGRPRQGLQRRAGRRRGSHRRLGRGGRIAKDVGRQGVAFRSLRLRRIFIPGRRRIGHRGLVEA